MIASALVMFLSFASFGAMPLIGNIPALDLPL